MADNTSREEKGAKMTDLSDDKLVARVPVTNSSPALIDAADLPLVERYTWRLMTHRNPIPNKKAFNYARTSPKTNGKRVQILMHRLIAGARPGFVVDHINGDGLDNRRRNLRVCTNQQNMENQRPIVGTSAYKGVSLEKSTGRWRAGIRRDKKKVILGSFKTEIEAARAYDAEAIRLRGEFALVNFPHGATP